MGTKLGYQRRRVAAGVALTAAVLLVLLFPTVLASAQPGSATDPDDTSLRLDLKTVSHDDDASSVTYTVETYEDFPDKWADFRWALDKNGDQKVDNFVSVQWEDSDAALVANVEDADENQIAKGTVTRPAANALRVSYPISVLKDVRSYLYRVSATTDANENGERDPGEEDVAPDTGWYEHRLGPAPASNTNAASSSPAPAASPSPSAAPVSPQSSPPSSPAPAPRPAPEPAAIPEAAPPGQTRRVAPAPVPQAHPTLAVPPKRGTSVAPRPVQPAGAVLPGGATPPAPPARPGRSETMPFTGTGHVWLALVGAGLVGLGVPCRSLARKRA